MVSEAKPKRKPRVPRAKVSATKPDGRQAPAGFGLQPARVRASGGAALKVPSFALRSPLVRTLGQYPTG
jgi:hypothetical protein